jgi:pectate lyase
MFYKVYDRNKMSEPFEVEIVYTHPADEAYNLVLENAGAILPKRDDIDLRIVNDVKNGTGKIIDTQSQVGGWPNYKSAIAPIDDDNDGLPDVWEIKHGLDSANNLDNNLDNDKDGYTNIEEWLNGTIP